MGRNEPTKLPPFLADRAPDREQPGRPARQSYTLTHEEFAALGGVAGQPELSHQDRVLGFRPDPRKPYKVTSHPVGIPTADTVHTWQTVADRVGCAMLTISWPDVTSPDFTARPL